MDGWTVFFLMLDGAAVVALLVAAVRVGRSDGGLRRRICLVEAAAYAGLFALVWLANPALSFGSFSIFAPDAAMAGFMLGLTVVVAGAEGWIRACAVAGTLTLWGALVFGVLLGHEDKQQSITDTDRDTAVLGEHLDAAHNHVAVKVLDRRPAPSDAGIEGASAERIRRSVLGRDTLTMVVYAQASCEPAVVLLASEGDTLDVLVMFERSIFLSPLPSPSVADSVTTGGLCVPATPADLFGSNFQTVKMAVQIDLPAGLAPASVRDVSVS